MARQSGPATPPLRAPHTFASARTNLLPLPLPAVLPANHTSVFLLHAHPAVNNRAVDDLISLMYSTCLSAVPVLRPAGRNTFVVLGPVLPDIPCRHAAATRYCWRAYPFPVRSFARRGRLRARERCLAFRAAGVVPVRLSPMSIGMPSTAFSCELAYQWIFMDDRRPAARHTYLYWLRTILRYAHATTRAGCSAWFAATFLAVEERVTAHTFPHLAPRSPAAYSSYRYRLSPAASLLHTPAFRHAHYARHYCIYIHAHWRSPTAPNTVTYPST